MQDISAVSEQEKKLYLPEGMGSSEEDPKITQRCKWCGLEKSEDCFFPSRRHTFGRLLACADCCNKYQNRYRKQRFGKMKKENPSAYSLYKAKKNKDQKRWKDTLMFGGNRIKALERDGFKCTKCGMTNNVHLSKYGCMLAAHHKDGKGAGAKVKNNELSNLQTLCSPCHTKTHAKTRRKNRT